MAPHHAPSGSVHAQVNGHAPPGAQPGQRPPIGLTQTIAQLNESVWLQIGMSVAMMEMDVVEIARMARRCARLSTRIMCTNAELRM